ncbi:MAG TPA: ribosome silencing factor [Oligoflexia bacterium]|nr:ribosome silencing factor [Oligoflexia bacterium]HMP27894.1 ribosome silencing factor [Oligoflexia bacterium]
MAIGLAKKLELYNSSQLTKSVINACQEAKAQDLLIIKTKGLTDISDYIVIASATSDRQAQGIANRVLAELSKEGIEPSGIEGLELGQWILLDLTEVVLHVFYEPTRRHYDLEGLWSKAEQEKL